jgi:transposase-like protein
MKISLKQFVYLVYFWTNKATNAEISQYLGISAHTIVDYLSFLRDICSWHLTTCDYMLGGEGKVVQIDESVVYRAKYNRGHALLAPTKWMLGIYDVEKKLGGIFFVEQRDRATIFPLIKKHVIPGSIICTDMWRAYDTIEDIDVQPRFVHRTVNHSVNFKDPIDGTHTNNVEAYWCSIKRKFKQLNGTSRANTSGYLDEHMYREKYDRNSKRELFDTFLFHISMKHYFD